MNRNLLPNLFSTMLGSIQTNEMVASLFQTGLRMQRYFSCYFLHPKHCSDECQSISSINMELNVVTLFFIKKRC